MPKYDFKAILDPEEEDFNSDFLNNEELIHNPLERLLDAMKRDQMTFQLILNAVCFNEFKITSQQRRKIVNFLVPIFLRDLICFIKDITKLDQENGEDETHSVQFFQVEVGWDFPNMLWQMRRYDIGAYFDINNAFYNDLMKMVKQFASERNFGFVRRNRNEKECWELRWMTEEFKQDTHFASVKTKKELLKKVKSANINQLVQFCKTCELDYVGQGIEELRNTIKKASKKLFNEEED